MSVDLLKRLEGGRVSVALRGGQRLDDCQLVSVPRAGCHNVWLFDGGADVFVALSDIVDLWETG